MSNTNTSQDYFSKSKKAWHFLKNASDELRSELVTKIGKKLRENSELIIRENLKDQEKLSNDDPKKDRLVLDESRVKEMADTAFQIAKMPDPTGVIQLTKKLDSGINLQKVSVPLGVVGVIYESRPNVTVDIALLCLKSGNVAVLKGGKEADFSNTILVNLMQEVLEEMKFPKDCLLLLPTDRAYTQMLLDADKYVDIIIPRGSAQLIEYVRANSKVPTIETGAGVCHTYVEKTADLTSAAAIVINAKVQRPSVCNSLDTILLNKEIAAKFLPKIIEEFKKYDVEIFADEESYSILKSLDYQKLKKAKAEDFGREYLDFACSIKVISGLDEALNHIEKFSSRHSECIVTENKELAEKFLQHVDAAAVYHNASTRFTDGGQFGLGAEIGISTQKLHARGPFGMEKLVTEKWIGRGNGQIRN